MVTVRIRLTACINYDQGENSPADCNAIVSEDGCDGRTHYIYAIENTGGVDVEIESVRVERDGSSNSLVTQPNLPADEIRLIADDFYSGVNICKDQTIVTTSKVVTESCKDSGSYTLVTPPSPTPPSPAPPTSPPIHFSYELDASAFGGSVQTAMLVTMS